MLKERLTNYRLEQVSYSTVRDYTRYYASCPELLGPKGDLKDVQRPWVLETVRKYVRSGQRVADMGGSSCELAACLMDEYELTVIDPYDGTGNGPTRMAHLQKRFPSIRFIRDVLNSQTDVREEYAAVVSTSVIEHVPPAIVHDAVLGIDNALEVGGFSIHAIDFTVRGEGAVKQRTDKILEEWCRCYGLAPSVLREKAEAMIADHETYFLSPLMYQQWRKGRAYDAYPWRQVGTLNFILEKVAARGERD